MATKVNKASRHRARLESALLARSEVVAKEHVVPAVEREVKAAFGLTVQNWNGSGENKQERPRAKVTVKVKKQRRHGVTITLNFLAVEGAGKPHRLWHWLDGGTRTRVQKRTSPPIRERRGLQTNPNRLEMTRFPGFTGRIFVIPAGKTVRGIPARHWYEKINIRAQEKSRAQVERRGFKFTNVRIIRP